METFFVNNSIYIVLCIVLMIWFGISSYLFSVDRKLSKLEKAMGEED